MLGAKHVDVIVDVLAQCLDPYATRRPSAEKLFCLLTPFADREDPSISLKEDYRKTADVMPEFFWQVADTKVRTTVLPSAIASCDSVARNIWSIVQIYVPIDNVLFDACRKLFQLLKNEASWSNKKCAVLAAVLTGSLIQRSARFQSIWCSKIAGCGIGDYENSLTRALSFAIANPEWSNPIFNF
jgi:hypothetical protein